MSASLPVVPPRIRQLAAELADPKPMRRGSLSERTIKCSKPSCACAHDPKARHGPYYSLTQAVGGKTRSRFLTGEQADVVRQQIDAGRKLGRSERQGTGMTSGIPVEDWIAHHARFSPGAGGLSAAFASR